MRSKKRRRISMERKSMEGKRILSGIIVFGLLMTLLFTSLPVKSMAAAAYVKAVRVSNTEVQLNVSSSKKVKVTVKTKGDETKRITAKSTDSSVAEVAVGKTVGNKTTITITGKSSGFASIVVKTKGENKKGKKLKKEITVFVFDKIEDIEDDDPEYDLPTYEGTSPSAVVAADLYASFTADSFVFSPYSIIDCMTLGYEGLSDTAKKALEDMGITAESISTLEAFDTLCKKDDTINVANKIYVNNIFANMFNTDLIRKDSSELVDMNADTVQKINSWIAEQTHDKIKNLIPKSAVNDETAMALVNAVWMKRPWLSEMSEKKITWKSNQKNYTAFSGDIGPWNVKDTDGISVVRMAYLREDKDQIPLSMYIITEDETGEKTPDEWIAENPDLSAAIDFENYSGLSGYTDVYVTVPNFKIENKQDMTNAIKSTGLGALFGDEAFSKIGPMEIDSIYHGAYIKVDKDGTEAAAATAVMAGATAFYEPVVRYINLDKPFIYIIKEETYGNILFMGRVDTDALSD